VANTDEPRREVPRDIFPEWTTRTHAVHAVKEAPRGEVLRGRFGGPEPRPRRTRMGFLLLVVAGAIAALYFMGIERSHVFQSRPDTNPALYAPDTQLEEAARARLGNETDLRGLDLTVIVREQVVTVSGRVPDIQRREKVLNIVRMTPNVTGVIDHLEVGEPPRPEPRRE
jgi:hypothetical protein